MSAPRLCIARVASLVAFAALSLIAACTVPTQGYCGKTSDCHASSSVCNTNTHACVTADAAGDAAVTSDAPADAPSDAPTTGEAGGDHPSGTDGPPADASDASADVFHGCVNNGGCGDPAKPICQTDGGVCVGCLGNGDCTTAGTRACDTAANKCVECVVGADCSDPTKPVCDQHACRSCKVDSECTGTGPGVCMSHLDGRCATDSETVYVAPTGCSDTPTDAGALPGTSTLPFCTSQIAIDSTAPTAALPSDAGAADAGSNDAGAVPASLKSLVVMRGMPGTFLGEWSFATSNRTITVVGQSNAVISPGTHIGIHLSNGTVYVRNLRVSGSTGTLPAVVADGGSLHMDRSIISGNLSGGVLIQGAAYDITNTVIASNMYSGTGCGGAWAGVCITNESPGTLGRFLNNTVINNTQVGVSCSGGAYLIQGSIVSGNTTPQTSGCTFMPCCSSDTVNVDPATFQLGIGSSCIDKLMANASTAYDIFGTPRPFGALSDCGAAEYITTGP